MATGGKTDIWVYADWTGLGGPTLIGTLSALQAKGRKAFSFAYEQDWLRRGLQVKLDPDLYAYPGPQYAVGKENFGIFSDAMPDTWGRKLMQRRNAHQARISGVPLRSLQEVDYLLGVHDFTRMGALRFKTDPQGPFLDNDHHQPAPPWTSIRELQHSAEVFESDPDAYEDEWLEVLLAPGSSLGGARPKANVIDEHGQLWIAKFPSNGDLIDKAAWEYLAHLLAIQSGIEMSECKLEHINGRYRTFFTKRFDRKLDERIHFSSAMTMTGYHEELIKDASPSYLEIAEFMQKNGQQPDTDLKQLWRRIVFNIAISNTDDHLRNHGFLLHDQGWTLSPAYDLNPSVDKTGLGLNIDMDSNDLDLDLVRSVGEYFDLSSPEMDDIIEQVRSGTENWRDLAISLGISRNEQEQMSGAFTFDQQFGLYNGYSR